MVSTWWTIGGILSKTIFDELFRKISNPLSTLEHSIRHILGMVGPVDMEQKGNE